LQNISSLASKLIEEIEETEVPLGLKMIVRMCVLFTSVFCHKGRNKSVINADYFSDWEFLHDFLQIGVQKLVSWLGIEPITLDLDS